MRIAKGQKRPATWRPAGPIRRDERKGPYVRTRTRLAHLLKHRATSPRPGPIPCDARALALDLGCSRRQVQDDLGRLADLHAWLFQNFHIVIFIKYRKHISGRCAFPQFYVVSRHRLHQVSGQMAGKVRARLFEKHIGEWFARMDRIFDLAQAMILRGEKAADDKHKGLPSRAEQGGAGKARPPPLRRRNRAASRRIEDQALGVTMRFRTSIGAEGIALKGWVRNRLLEWHSIDRIEECLRHGLSVYRKGIQAGAWMPANFRSWVLGVAQRHLDGDGLAVQQRKWQRKQEARGEAFKDWFDEPDEVE